MYAVCEQEVIDKLISFDSEYVSYKKEEKKIKKLRKHGKLNFDLYTLEYQEQRNKYFKIIFKVIKQDYNKGANFVKNILIAEDDLDFAREHLDNFDVQF